MLYLKRGAIGHFYPFLQKRRHKNFYEVLLQHTFSYVATIRMKCTVYPVRPAVPAQRKSPTNKKPPMVGDAHAAVCGP